MSTESKKEYLIQIRKRYTQTRTRGEKTAIVLAVAATLDIERKSAIRLIGKKPRTYTVLKRGKQEIYTYDLIAPLTQIWIVAGKPCSKRLQPQMGELLNKLKECNEIRLYGKQEELLRKIKPSTIDKLLEAERDLSKKEYGVSGTKRSPLLKSLIPVRTYFTKEEYQEPGHAEMDCVVHCGNSLSGIYGETLNILDIATHWNEKKIFLHKTKVKIVGAFHELRNQFPFSISSVDFDNGYEFVNWHLKMYCEKNGIDYTRSRSYHKNDQAHIEGKNYQSIRKVVGYDRIDEEEIVQLIDDIYQNEHRLLTNFIYTTMKLQEKRKDATGHTTKIYELAKTPYQRVLDSDTIPEEQKRQLQAQYQQINPAQLQRSLQNKLDHVYRLMKQKKIISSVTGSYHATPLPQYLFGNT